MIEPSKLDAFGLKNLLALNYPKLMPLPVFILKPSHARGTSNAPPGVGVMLPEGVGAPGAKTTSQKELVRPYSFG